MELVTGKSLSDYIVEKKRLHEHEVKHFMFHLMSAIKYIHSKGIVHRDLKPDNVMLEFNKYVDDHVTKNEKCNEDENCKDTDNDCY